MKISISKKQKTEKHHVPDNEHIWFEMLPAKAKDRAKLSQNSTKIIFDEDGKVIKEGIVAVRDMDQEKYHETVCELLIEKIVNFGGIEDEDTGKKLEFSKENLEILLNDLYDLEIGIKKDEKGKEKINEITKKPQPLLLGDWLVECMTERRNIEGDTKN